MLGHPQDEGLPVITDRVRSAAAIRRGRPEPRPLGNQALLMAVGSVEIRRARLCRAPAAILTISEGANAPPLSGALRNVPPLGTLSEQRPT
jgi:hypothetical protein